MRVIDNVDGYVGLLNRLSNFCSRFDVLAIAVPYSRFLDKASRIDVVARASNLLSSFGKKIIFLVPSHISYEEGGETVDVGCLGDLAKFQRVGVVIPFNPHREMDTFVQGVEASGVPVFDVTLGIIHASRVLQNSDYSARGAIDACYALLSDRDSQEAFIKLLIARRTGDATVLAIAPYEEYDHPLLRLSQQQLIADCGAFVGSTAHMFLARSPGTRVVSFEPSAETFLRLQESRNAHALSGQWKLEHGAVDCQTGSGSFGGSGLGARVGGGDEQIRLHSLDDYFRDDAPSLIKMDIEGSEINAILGARRLIRTHKPALVICVYHLDDDLWKIPLLIASINSEYKFYLGHHGDILYETVLYAV